MNKVNSIYQIPDLVLEAWREQWSPHIGFDMLCGRSRYHVPPSNKYDLWVWVRSNAQHVHLRGRIDLRAVKATD